MQEHWFPIYPPLGRHRLYRVKSGELGLGEGTKEVFLDTIGGWVSGKFLGSKDVEPFYLLTIILSRISNKGL